MRGNLDVSDINLAAGEASEAPASSSFPVVTWRITRDALSNVLMLSHGIAIVGCGGLTDLLLWREPPFRPDYSQVSIASMVFYVLVSVGIGNFPAASGTKVSVGYLKSAIAWLAAVLLLALVILTVRSGGQYSRLGLTAFALAGLVAVTAVNGLASRFIAVRLKRAPSRLRACMW